MEAEAGTLVESLTRHGVLSGLLISIISLTLSLIFCEVAFRAFVDVTDIPFSYWDPVIGPRKAPNQSGRYLKGDFIAGRYRFNAQGWNHVEDYLKEKEPGTFRVCLVGDSYVEAPQVMPDETMYAVAQRRTNLRDRPTQWYAFGVSGFGTAEEYEVIRNYALDYQPDLVILLFVQNDPFETSPYIRDLPSHVVRFILDDEGEIRRFAPTQWTPIRWRRLAARSAMVRYFMLQKGILARFRNRTADRGVGGESLRERAGFASASIVEDLDLLSGDERGRKTWELIEKLLDETREECARRGARFAIAFRGWAAEIDAPIEPELERAGSEEDDPYCLDSRLREMGRQCLAPIAARLGIPYLDLTASLRSAVAATGESHRFPDDNHYSQLGHAAAGEALAAWAEELRAAGSEGSL